MFYYKHVFLLFNLSNTWHFKMSHPGSRLWQKRRVEICTSTQDWFWYILFYFYTSMNDFVYVPTLCHFTVKVICLFKKLFFAHNWRMVFLKFPLLSNPDVVQTVKYLTTNTLRTEFLQLFISMNGLRIIFAVKGRGQILAHWFLALW